MQVWKSEKFYGHQNCITFHAICVETDLRQKWCVTNLVELGSPIPQLICHLDHFHETLSLFEYEWIGKEVFWISVAQTLGSFLKCNSIIWHRDLHTPWHLQEYACRGGSDCHSSWSDVQSHQRWAWKTCYQTLDIIAVENLILPRYFV